MRDAFGLERFVAAQEAGGTYARALAELRAGRKRSHWMWFVFPQLEGLGGSATAREFALSSAAEARAYLGHPLLGARLLECSRALLGLAEDAPEDVLGPIDAVKLRSCMTLFAVAAPQEPVFAAVLGRWYGGLSDPATLALLAGGAG